MLASHRPISTSASGSVADVHAAARAILFDPLTNKGTAFTEIERDALGLHGMLPPHISNMDNQILRRRRALDALPDDFHRYTFLRELQDSNEILFHALVQSDLPHLLPLIYTPTVGEGCERFSEIWRRPRGLFLSWPNRHRVAEILADPSLDAVKIIVVSDGERILGLGDQGAGGMGIPIGKLALYTACAGIHPAETLPILLDVGTDNTALREDPLYVGWRHPRIRGSDYDAFVGLFVDAVKTRWPGAIVQWEDFAGTNAARLLGRFRDWLPSFNDDIQGTAATVVGAVLAALAKTGRSLAEQRVVLFGAGAAGCGIAELLVEQMVSEGIRREDACRTIWAVDRQGLLMNDMPGLTASQRRLARSIQDIEGWNPDTISGLLKTVVNVRPTILIGTSGQRGAFSEAVVRSMSGTTARPIIFALSNPTSKSEGSPSDILKWSSHRAIVGTGSPYAGGCDTRDPMVAQVNNAYVFPGIGLGALVSGARAISDGMFLAAARALADRSETLSSLLPPIDDLRGTALAVATAVARHCEQEELASSACNDWAAAIASRMWRPAYAQAHAP